jgi:hypothetical protein
LGPNTLNGIKSEKPEKAVFWLQRGPHEIFGKNRIP